MVPGSRRNRKHQTGPPLPPGNISPSTAVSFLVHSIMDHSSQGGLDPIPSLLFSTGSFSSAFKFSPNLKKRKKEKAFSGLHIPFQLPPYHYHSLRNRMSTLVVYTSSQPFISLLLQSGSHPQHATEISFINFNKDIDATEASGCYLVFILLILLMASTIKFSFFLWKLSVVFPGLLDTTFICFFSTFLASPIQFPSWTLFPLTNEFPRNSLLGTFFSLPVIMSL